MTAFEKSSNNGGAYYELETHYDRFQPMVNCPRHGVLD